MRSQDSEAPGDVNNAVSQKKTKSCFAQKGYSLEKGDQHSVIAGDIQNNPTFADFSYHNRMVGFLALKFHIFPSSVLCFHFCYNFNEKI